MNRFQFSLLSVAIASLLLLLPVRAQTPFQWPERGTNLQVLDEDTSQETLRSVMRGFSRSLGVNCSHCHVGEPDQELSTYDFASDEKPMKETAREMLRMLQAIDGHLQKIEPSGQRVNMWCHTCHRGAARPTTLLTELSETYERGGADSSLSRYEELRERHFAGPTFDFREATLNAFGYRLLPDDPEGAIDAFRRNAELYPESANAWDSLAEGYLALGRTETAIAYYERSLQLDPDHRNAEEQLRKIRSGELPAPPAED